MTGQGRSEEWREKAVSLTGGPQLVLTPEWRFLIGPAHTMLRSHWSSVEIFSWTARSYYICSFIDILILPTLRPSNG